MSSTRQRPWQTVTLVLGFAFLYLPIAWIIVFSFSGYAVDGVGSFPSVHWYDALRNDDELLGAAYRSLALALWSSPIAALLGASAGIALGRLEQFPGRGLLLALLAVPIFAPEILLGFSFLMLFAALESLTGWTQGKGMLTLVVAHATLGAPVVATVVFARVLGRDRSLEDAARDLGARPLRVLLTVTLPLGVPAILSGWLLAMTLSFDDVVTSSFLAGPENTTLPMVIFSSLRVGVNPEINAIGALIIAGVASMFTVAFLTAKYGARVTIKRVRG
ncbi:MAG: ABC transporter permease [Steroidobacteraceae bacterium]